MKQAPATEPKRAAIYTRKSTSEGLDSDFNTLDAQRAGAEHYAAALGWKVLPERYDDGGFTGANTDRPALQRLLADIRARKVDVVIVYKIDRLSRSLLDFARLIETIEGHGCSLVAVTQQLDTSSSMGRLTLNILLSFAQFERELISERTRDKMAAAKRKGKWCGGPTPFGYDRREKKLVPSELEATVVRELFAVLARERTLAGTARALNAAGLRPRSGGWTKDSVLRVARNKLYLGVLECSDGTLVKGEHAALIDQAAFDAVAPCCSQQAAARLCSDAAPLRGKLRCACGGALTPGSSGGRPYYRCATRDRYGRERCPAKALPAREVERYVRDALAARGVGIERLTRAIVIGDSIRLEIAP